MPADRSDRPAMTDPAGAAEPPESTEPRRFRYGPHPDQYAELTSPAAGGRIAVVIHGGYWRAAFDAALGRAPARALARSGWQAWNVEYRRVGRGGGWPETFTDIAAALDMIGTWARAAGPAGPGLVLIGHSAGGHLAAWAARRAAVPIAGVVSQAGVLDLQAAGELGLSRGAAFELMGTPSEFGAAFAAADPSRAIPLGVPVRCVHSRADVDVPFSQSEDFVRRSRAAGGDAELIEASGDHFSLIDPDHADWRLCTRAAAELVGPPADEH